MKNLLQIDSDDYGLRASVNLAICLFLEGNFIESRKYLLSATKIQEKTTSESKNERVYWRYLSSILKWHKKKYFGVKILFLINIFFEITLFMELYELRTPECVYGILKYSK